MLSSKKELAKTLSKLEELKDANCKLEQYRTDSEVAAEVLWFLYMNNDIEGKIIADLGCGNGVFGIGCLLLKADRVYFVDKDDKVLDIAKKDYRKLKLKNGKFFCCSVSKFNKKVDVVIENPPFGVQVKHSDRVFLDKAMEISDLIYSFHKVESENFLKKYCEGFSVEKLFDIDFVLRRTMKFHKRNKYYVKVGFFRINRKI